MVRLTTAAMIIKFTILMIIIAKLSLKTSCTAKKLDLPIINTATVALALMYFQNTA